MKACSEVLRRVMRNTFWDAYDHLGTLVVANVLWVLFCLPVLTIPMATAGMLRVTYEMAVSRDASVGDFFRGALALWMPSTALGVAALSALCLGLVNVLFYANLAQAYPFLGWALAAFCFWLALALVCAAQFALPAAVELWTADDARHLQRAAWLPRPAVNHCLRLGLETRPASVRTALKVGFLLLAKAPVVAVILLLNLLFFWGLCVATGVGIALVATGVTCLALHHVYGETVAELTGLGDRRAHEARSLRELLPPWDEGKGRRP